MNKNMLAAKYRSVLNFVSILWLTVARSSSVEQIVVVSLEKYPITIQSS